MRETELIIGNRSYRLTVDEAQQERLQAVAGSFDRVVSRLRSDHGGNIDRDRLLVLAGLMLADELYNHRAQAQTSQTEQTEQVDAAPIADVEAFHRELADRLEALGQQLRQG